MLEILQKFLLVTISVVAVLLFTILILDKYSSRQIVEKNIGKIRRVIGCTLIGSIIVATLNVTLNIIYLEIRTLFSLIMLMSLVNVMANKIPQFWIAMSIGSLIILVIAEFVYSLIVF